MAGDPNTWVNSDNTVIDVAKDKFRSCMALTHLYQDSFQHSLITRSYRWENLGFDYNGHYVVFSEAISSTVNILHMPTDIHSTHLTHHPIWRADSENGNRILSVSPIRNFYSNKRTQLHVFISSLRSLDVDWLADCVYVAESRGLVSAIKLRLPIDREAAPQTSMRVVYNNSQNVITTIKLHPSVGYVRPHTQMHQEHNSQML